MAKDPEFCRVPPACEIWIGKSEANALYEEIKHVPEGTLLGQWRDGWLLRKIDEMKNKKTRYFPLTDAF
jgi:hypothetical protein